MGNMPVKKLQDGAIKTAVFEQNNPDGRVSYSVVLERSFKKKDAEQWESQKLNFFVEDLLKIATLCERTYWAICELRENKTPAPKPVSPVAQAPAQAPVDMNDIPFD